MKEEALKELQLSLDVTHDQIIYVSGRGNDNWKQRVTGGLQILLLCVRYHQLQRPKWKLCLKEQAALYFCYYRNA